MKKQGNEPIVQLTGVSKVFRSYERKRDRIKDLVNPAKERLFKEKCVLKNIDLTIYKGESMGIIGKNGSGKSTLLQIICGTMKASEGIVVTKGRVGALLELGSGFSPEFTGIENIYLNAAIHGLKRKDIEQRLDDILAFADIGDAVNEKVKTYSSGMVVRLGFSVMANIDADILVVDEALAVGDAFFTQKCMRFINNFREENTLLFVSHDTTAVQSSCEKAIYLCDGKVKVNGSTKTVVEAYIKDLQGNSAVKSLPNKKIVNKDEHENANWKYEKEDNKGHNDRWKDYRLKRDFDREKNGTNTEIFVPKKSITRDEKSYGGVKAVISEVRLENNEEGSNKDIYIEGGNIVKLEIIAVAKEKFGMPILGFIMKDKNGLELIGDNTSNLVPESDQITVKKDEIIRGTFIFTMPLL